MSVIDVDLSPKPAKNAMKRQGFWRGLAQAVDALFAYPAKHAVSEDELRRADQDIERFERLMHKNTPLADAGLNRAPRLRRARAIQVR